MSAAARPGAFGLVTVVVIALCIPAFVVVVTMGAVDLAGYLRQGHHAGDTHHGR